MREGQEEFVLLHLEVARGLSCLGSKLSSIVDLSVYQELRGCSSSRVVRRSRFGASVNRYGIGARQIAPGLNSFR